MAAKSKWIPGLDPDQLASSAAKQAVCVRLAAVWHWLPLAAKRAIENPEYVHQLRVASRRAAAAMAIFWEFLPAKQAKRVKRHLKAVRGAAGTARDLDVLADRWEKATTQTRSLLKLLPLIERDRNAAQPAILHAYVRLRRDGHPKLVKKLIKRIGFRGIDGNGHEPSLRQIAESHLQPLCEVFLEAAACDLHDLETLHRLRIAGKRLRYAMELFASAFEPSFRQGVYATVEELQSRLGDINDRAAARVQLLEWSKSLAPAPRAALKKLAASEASACERSRLEFVAWWTRRRQASFRRQLRGHFSPAKPSKR